MFLRYKNLLSRFPVLSVDVVTTHFHFLYMSRIKIRHYRQVYTDSPDPIVFLTVTVNTSGHVYDDFIHLFFLYVYRDASILTGELTEESEQFRFL